eukprot:scaffold13725_cov44-Cyclotella_meneghiniana.AAC.3
MVMVVTKNVLTPYQLDGARREVKLLGDLLDSSNHQNDNDVRQDQCTSGISEVGLIGWLRASDYRYKAVTAILYLNSPHWENNGVLRCFESQVDGNNRKVEQERYVDVGRVGGTMVLFDSARVEHQMQPSTED